MSTYRASDDISTTMIYVLGLNHHLEQFRHVGNDPKAVARLQNYVRVFCTEKSIQLIAEEWSDDATKYWEVESTYCEDVATDLGIAYLPCDPNLTERARLGIRSRQEIAEELGIEFAMVHFYPEDEELVNAAAGGEDIKRERHWLEKLIEPAVASERILLLCGYEHVERFITLAQREGYQATRIAVQ